MKLKVILIFLCSSLALMVSILLKIEQPIMTTFPTEIEIESYIKVSLFNKLFMGAFTATVTIILGLVLRVSFFTSFSISVLNGFVYYFYIGFKYHYQIIYSFYYLFQYFIGALAVGLTYFLINSLKKRVI